MKHLIALTSLVAALAGCTAAQQTAVNNVETQTISATQYACTMASTLTAAPEVALVCGIVEEGEVLATGMTQFIEGLINSRQTQVAAGKTFDMATRTWIAPVLKPPVSSTLSTVAPAQPAP